MGFDSTIPCPPSTNRVTELVGGWFFLFFVFFLNSHTHSLASRETLKSCFWFVGGNLLISKVFQLLTDQIADESQRKILDIKNLLAHDLDLV